MEERSKRASDKHGMNRTEKIICLFWLGIAIFVCVGSIKLHLGSFPEPGPGFLPFGAALFLGILALIQFMRVTLRPPEESEESPWAGIDPKKAIYIIVSLFLYAFLLPWLGYILATFFLMLFFFTFLKKMPWWIVISYTIAVIVISYLLFDVWLMVQLPKGILEIG
jgi:putative tricarboxylic transport membrane protein